MVPSGAGVQALADLRVSAMLATRSDGDGNGVVETLGAVVVGRTTPGALVEADRGGDGRVDAMTRAGADGSYRVVVPLPIGRSVIQVTARDRSGRTATTSLKVARGDAVIDANETFLDLIRVNSTDPPTAARNLAMYQLAVYNAVAASSHSGGLYHLRLDAPRGSSPAAAAAEAAYRVALSLYPRQAATLDAMRRESFATVTDPRARALGIKAGDAAAAAMIALRANDGVSTHVAYTPGTQPGDWVPTPPAFAPPVGVQYLNVTPFVANSASQFTPSPPPPLDSAEYAAELNQVESVGGVDSTTRKADETALAAFWSDLPGRTFTPPGHWNQIAQDASLMKRDGLLKNARLFAYLDAALADGGICCWSAKYVYNRWRPVTAIREANLDGNAATTANPTWTPLWATPAFPAYTSGHSTFSASAQTVLDAFFGKRFAFIDAGDPSQGYAPRSFSSFEQAADEAGWSRIVGGIHFMSDNLQGLAGGRAIGVYVLAHLLPEKRA